MENLKADVITIIQKNENCIKDLDIAIQVLETNLNKTIKHLEISENKEKNITDKFEKEMQKRQQAKFKKMINGLENNINSLKQEKKKIEDLIKNLKLKL